MTIQELQEVIELVMPYRNGSFCLAASHDEIRIFLDKKPPADVAARLHELNCPLSWQYENDDGVFVDNDDDDSFTVTCFP